MKVCTALLCVTALSSYATPQSPVRFDLAEANQALSKLADLLQQNFIYPDIAKRYAALLRSKVRSNAYAGSESRQKFVQAATKDLQEEYREGHLLLLTGTPGKAVPPKGREAHVWGVGRWGWFSPKVAYLAYNGFSGNHPEYMKVLGRLRQVLEGFAGAETLIIDAREFLGGAPHEIDVIAEHVFDKRATLLWMDTRVEAEKANPLANHPTIRRIDGPEGVIRREHFVEPKGAGTKLKRARIYVLTSKRTVSSGEHFALAMKRTRRATIIGERTAGAGHFGKTTPLGGDYYAFVPVGRGFDPDTGKGWERTGVTPHVSVPASRALDKALRRAGLDAARARDRMSRFQSG